MHTKHRNVIILMALAVTAAFSSVSISAAYYFQSSQISGLECQEDASSKGKLAYVTRGVVYKSNGNAAKKTRDCQLPGRPPRRFFLYDQYGCFRVG